jgi:hypothetical protein
MKYQSPQYGVYPRHLGGPVTIQASAWLFTTMYDRMSRTVRLRNFAGLTVEDVPIFWFDVDKNLCNLQQCSENFVFDLV